MKIKIENITPQLAKLWLEDNKNFREPKRKNIAKMVQDMKAGKWELNGETIKWDTDGNLVDGQNRLMACIEADVPFKSVVAYDVESDLNIDCGTQRRLADYLRYHGCERFAGDVASTLRMIWTLRRHGRCYAKGYGDSATNQQLINLYMKEPTITDTVCRIQRQKSAGLSASLAGALIHLFREKDEVMAEKFVRVLEGSLSLAVSDPVMQLRERLIKDRLSRARISTAHKCALAILAWNHWRNGTASRNLNWRESGPTAMKFPNIV